MSLYIKMNENKITFWSFGLSRIWDKEQMEFFSKECFAFSWKLSIAMLIDEIKPVFMQRYEFE